MTGSGAAGAIAATAWVFPDAALAQALDLSPYRGKIVYLDFWASWCGPCKLSFPFMEDLKRAYPADLAVIAVNVDREKPRADAFLKTMGSTLSVVYDPKGEIASAFGVKDMPTSILIGRDGRAREVHPGFAPERAPALRARVETLIRAS